MRNQLVDFNSAFYDQSDPVVNSLYVDLAITYKPIQPDGGHHYVTGLWSEFKQVLGVFFATFFGLGGFKYTEKNHHIKSVQAYGVWKHAFFKRVTTSSLQAKDFLPMDALVLHTCGNCLSVPRHLPNWDP